MFSRMATKRTATKSAARTTAAKSPARKESGRPGTADGARKFWLVKSEPSTFSFDDLMRARGRTTGWDGVRNYQARNFMRDEMRPGDGVLFYHSNAEPPAVVGVAEVAGAAYPDPTQFDPRSDYHDPKATPDAPIWMQVDIRGIAHLPRPMTLEELRKVPELAEMELLRKGSRLSVQPVREREWQAIAGATPGRPRKRS